MDDVAKRSARDRYDLFITAASDLGFTPAIVEKDFWVCWLLKRVFALPGFEGAFLFKGDTSLAKVYNAIDRFSEDVDLVWDRSFLGFGGENDPLSDQISQTRAENQLIPALLRAARAALRDKLVPALTTAVEANLGEWKGWEITIQEHDSQPSILFHYPSVRGIFSDYVKPYVVLELVPRSEPVPSGEAVISPYLVEVVGKAFKDPGVRVRHILVTRTFWEKATILHMYHHFPNDKPFGERFSRHYYDLFRLFQRGHFEEAIKDLDLLRRVVRHKKRFFRSGPARYDDAAAGKLCLVPQDARMECLLTDYEAMSEMFFGDPPPFEDIISTLREIEARLNPLMAPKPTE